MPNLSKNYLHEWWMFSLGFIAVRTRLNKVVRWVPGPTSKEAGTSSFNISFAGEMGCWEIELAFGQRLGADEANHHRTVIGEI
ncbi:predicted protein [Sclerotinia sclerotiorum 1980 UF-70]|uniref:Uncharacterized protein n=1 Tax=Sclerotinia sclerotiorum (strain ATCC 18683 / 1980 / Ss-1) TaxID=665079 RepID=A7ETD8_SCLS1|nr:predicted protein [Sclerotinia sclerotiorum 1980 UF-70]EDN92730.1 predicted protein [Sclerotinia sclerotiorum 1980 UF-70]